MDRVADLAGFTTMAEDMTPEEVMTLLRDFHGRVEESRGPHTLRGRDTPIELWAV